MALKYWFEFTDIKRIVNRVEILNDDFVDDATQIYGSCTLTKSSVKDTLEVIRSGGLKIELEASLDLTLEDLYSEVERTYQVIYYRDSQVIFKGWLDTDGLFQSYVQDKWKINLTATDGLGYLKNLSYVDNDTQESFLGKQKQIKVISNCLKRTNINQDIYVNIDIKYFGSDINRSILDQATVNNFRYIKSDGSVMNCLEVLTSILETYNAVITQKNGIWYIYRPNDLVDNTNLRYFKFDYDGIAFNPVSETFDLDLNIGSAIDNFYPHHANANQVLSIDNSIGAYRINYRYGLTNALFENIYLESEIVPPATEETIEEWTIDDYTGVSFPSDNLGLIVYAQLYQQGFLVAHSNNITTLEGDLINFCGILNSTYPGFIRGRSIESKFTSKVILTGTSNTYYLNKQGIWGTSDTFIELRVQQRDVDYSFEISAEPTPEDGDVYIQIYTPTLTQFDTLAEQYTIKKLTLAPANDLGNIKGEVHDFQRISKPSSKIAETKEVFNGDLESELYVGTIYEEDAETPTNFWNTLDGLNSGVILKIMGIEKMRMNNKPLKIFKGDVYGFLDYLSVIDINGINGKFMPLEYEYNAKTNISKIKLKEILNDDILSDIQYDSYLDYGDVTDPTISN